ncbi:RNA polymerase sigma factor [Ohtaekwangia koreensis]|jgi:RNA polymerase sigma factor (sigma-70 family)|uniref:RNA polymerase sigma-70 factor, ECF subfamily n=1 Tax=Ohtaekwangia koreensis TaxID=688867 RepID=A0A1T5K460_9BACT|nr:sigma-70 family RNA polymerase sigma factor [Ohtaekwangia koreensis]SKC58269.1 RNA polymerase sigma-70 factor, ECF subfamily [Ohtaekwangia koreensis]
MHGDSTIDMELQQWDAMRGGDEQAFSWLYDRYFKLLYNYGRKIGTSEAALEDGIHDLFVDLWRFRKTLSSTTSVRFYLYRSLRRRLMRNDSRNSYFTSDGSIIEDALKASTPSSEENLIDEEDNHQRIYRLKKLLSDLSPRQYEALILRYYDEMAFDEIAAILNVNEQSARNLVQRGLLQLRHYAKYVISLTLFCLLS